MSQQSKRFYSAVVSENSRNVPSGMGRDRAERDGVVIQWDSRRLRNSPRVGAAMLGQLEAENTELRQRAVELALEIQDLRCRLY